MYNSSVPLRLVVKVGTSTLTQDTGSLNLRSMDQIGRASCRERVLIQV